MKFIFTFVPVFVLFSITLANKWIGDLVKIDLSTYPTSSMPTPIPWPDTEVVEVHFSDLWFFAPQNNLIPMDTFVFALDCSKSKFDFAKGLTVDLTGMRDTSKNIQLSVKACGINDTACFPPQTSFTWGMFETARQVIMDLKKQGSTFYLFLQVQQVSGKDNPNFSPNVAFWAQSGNMFRDVTISRRNSNGVALWLSYGGKNY